MKQLTLRLPDDLHARLKEASARDQRSMHAQILWLLERTLRDGGDEQPRKA